MSKYTILICLALPAAGWSTSLSAPVYEEIEVEKEVEISSPDLLRLEGTAPAGSLRIRIEMPSRLQRRFTARLVQTSGRRIPIRGSLVGCRRGATAKSEWIELDSFQWGEPSSGGSPAQATKRRDGDYLVRVAAREPGSRWLELVLPAQLLADRASASRSSPSAPDGPSNTLVFAEKYARAQGVEPNPSTSVRLSSSPRCDHGVELGPTARLIAVWLQGRPQVPRHGVVGCLQVVTRGRWQLEIRDLPRDLVLRASPLGAVTGTATIDGALITWTTPRRAGVSDRWRIEVIDRSGGAPVVKHILEMKLENA